ncbi:MAG: response regulator [Planctomycetes bacterium]|nr:response regulator [Planctomycetota bacterium]
MASSLNGKNILLVDDDKDMITALTTVLDGSGAEIETASDGNEAIEAATEFNPDLVILDAMLPKRSGFLVLEKLKTTKKRGVRPLVIMITGNAGKRHQTWAESLGVDGYLNKPFRMERLVEQMETLLAKN